MTAMYINPKQFENAMIEVNIAFDIANKRIDMLQERVKELETAMTPNKTSKKETA